MRKQLEERLQSLKSEFTVGQQRLADLEAQAANLRNTLLRISGAVQVLEEMLAMESRVEPSSDRQVNETAGS